MDVEMDWRGGVEMEKRCRVVVDRRAGQERSRTERRKLFLESEEVWRKGTAERMTGQKRTEEWRNAERG
jgi:hypothetical protein